MDTPKAFSMTKTQIASLIADGKLLASLQKHGVSDDALADVAKNIKLQHSVHSNEYTELTFKFDPAKNGFHVNATIKF